MTTRGSRKNCYGGKPNNAPPPPHAEKRPPPTRKKWHGPHVERNDCPHRKNTPVGETPPPPDGIFIYMLPPWRAPISPLACADHDLHSLYSVCLRELEKNQQKLNRNKNFLALSFNFLGGGGVSIVSNTQKFIYR